MKAKNFLPFILSLILLSCGTNDRTSEKSAQLANLSLPLDKGFSEYINAYTSGVVSVNSAIEVQFNPDFIAKANKKNTSGLFEFSPSIKGKAEWKDETTLVFRPSEFLKPGEFYAGALNLHKLAAVPETLKRFPLKIQTPQKDFSVVVGELECPASGEEAYNLSGNLTASDYIDPQEVEEYITARLGRDKIKINWDHSAAPQHRFVIENIRRTEKLQELNVSWDGSSHDVKQKGSCLVRVYPAGEFSVIDVRVDRSPGQKIDIVFSDPLDAAIETEGLIWLNPGSEVAVSKNSNIVSLTPAGNLTGSVELFVETGLKNIRGKNLSSRFSAKIDFKTVLPGIELTGKGVILPVSENLIFPFRAANLNAVDLTIIKVYENNLLYYLHENDLNTDYHIKRFGRPVWSGKVDLSQGSSSNQGSWNLYTINIASYIDVEPGVLYKVRLGMRKSYSTYECGEQQGESMYDKALEEAEAKRSEFWSDDEVYYEDFEDEIYYSMGFDWKDRNNPCKEAFFSPDKNVSRNILASNLGIIAKMGSDNLLHITVSDLASALPVNEAAVEVYDYQMQLIANASTDQRGMAAVNCERKPFVVITRKDKDRNYLKTNDGSSLSLSSFDVSGSQPEKGIKAFIYGERDVWRPGDSIFLSFFVKDMTSNLPADHPVQFELINPLEQKVDNQVQKSGGNKLLVFRTRTSDDAVTGAYRAQFRIGGAVFTKRIRIETVKPNRLKINLSFPGEILTGSVSGNMNVKWLNGNVARNLKSTVEYIFRPVKTEFKKYSQYIFDDPSKDFSSESSGIFDGKLDNDGDARIYFNPSGELKAPGMLNAIFTAKVSEQGGDESIISSTWKYAPYPVFVGMNFPGLQGKGRMLFTDRENEIRIVTVDQKGNPLTSEVDISVYKISYRWWWESDGENLGYYISHNIYKPEFRAKIKTQGGEGSFRFNIDKHKWGRYFIMASVPGGHSSGKILLIDWPWEYGMKGNAEGASLLAISTDKEKYEPGDEIQLSFPAPENARAIITLENSAGVLSETRENTTGINTIVKIKASPEMAPNVYAYVTVIQPHSQTSNDMPVRLYGIVPVMVEDKETRLRPGITTVDETRSRSPFQVMVSEENRKPMDYTLAIVDEGLLDITGFKTPDPWNYFYAREALGVKTWDLYDLVLGAFGGTLERAFAIGGDEAAIDRSAGKVQRFIPVVRFLGPFKLGAGKTNTHTVNLPQYTGSVRVMVIAGNDRAFGSAEKPVIVRDPLMVLVTAPRVISPGEKASLPVTAFVQKKGINSLDLQVQTSDLFTVEESRKTIPVKPEEENNTEFTFTAGEKTGAGRIRVTASGGGETAEYDLALEVRSPNPPETRNELKILKPGEKWETSFTPFGIEGSNSAAVELSMLPSVNLEKRLDYLISYPYGCSEQVISAAFPQLMLKELSGNDPSVTARASDNVRSAISLIASRQMAGGGIALWPGAIQADNWVTSYAGHFITEAERTGFPVSPGFRQKWISYQKKAAREWMYDRNFTASSNDQAYRLFSLALAKDPDKGAMNRMREADSLPHLAKWLLAAAFITSGRPEAANDIIDMRVITPDERFAHYNYGSILRDKAVILYTLTLLKNEEAALPLLKEISDELSNNTWYSTQSISWGLFAYMKWAAMMPGNKGQAKAGLILNGKKSENIIPANRVVSEMIRLVNGTNQVTVENTSAQPLYANLTLKGIASLSDQSREERGAGMKIRYVTTAMEPLDPASLEQGTDFMMIVNVTNNTFSKVSNIALSQMIPSGWEILNTRMYEADYGFKESSFDYRDIRDDRINTFFSLNPGETKSFAVVLNASYKGEFYHPAVLCEGMYTKDFYSRYPGMKVTVKGKN